MTLLLGDCLDQMAGLADGCVDLTVTSPPYDNLRTYNNSLNDWTEAKWQAVIAELYRVTKPGGVVVWVVADATINGSETGTSFKQALFAISSGFNLHDTMIWDKIGVGAKGSRKAYWQAFEFMFVFAKSTPSVFCPVRDRPHTNAGNKAGGGRNRRADGSFKSRAPKLTPAFGSRTNVWAQGTKETSVQQGALEGGHPAAFPEALARDHILSWSNEGDTVLDPFMGSGTTGKMALAHGRKFIGIERDPTYFAIAEQRVQPMLREAAE